MIVLYTKHSCGYCELAKNWLDANRIEYTTVDVSTPGADLDFLVSQGHRSIPQIYLMVENQPRLLISGGAQALLKMEVSDFWQTVDQVSGKSNLDFGDLAL